MRSQYRVTKYNPTLRDGDGAYRREDWTAHSDIGRQFNGVLLSDSNYLAVEAAYLFAVEAFLREAKIEALLLRGLENSMNTELPGFIHPEATLTVPQCIDFSRLALREMVWGKLVAPGRAYVHFGYDYYMYIGLPSQCQSSVTEVQARGLFVEKFRSPYLRERLNPTFRRTRSAPLR